MNNDLFFYAVCAILIAGIVHSYITLRKGRGDDYVYVSRKDKTHYFANYELARQLGFGVRMIPKKTARARGLVLYRGDKK